MIDLLLWVGVVVWGSALLFNIPHLARKTRGVRGALRWIALAWLLLFFGLAVFVVRSHIVASVEDVDSSAISQLSMFGGAFFILLGLVASRSGVIARNIIRIPVLMLTIYGVLAVMSALYSPSPALSAYKGILILIDVLMVLVALSYLPLAGPEYKSMLLNLSYFLLSLMVFGAALGGVLYPESAKHVISGVFGYQLYGLWPALNPNELGFISAITGIVALRRFFEKTTLMEKYFWFAQLYVSVVVLIIAQARTSVISFALSALILSMLIRKLRLMGITVLLLVIVVVTYGVTTGGNLGLVNVVEEYSARGLSEKQLGSLTGRTELWASGRAMLYDSPSFGHGYDAGVKIAGEAYGIERGLHMHNAHFQVLVNSGIAGYMVWFVMLVSVSRMVFIPIFRMRWPLYLEADRFHAEAMAVLVIILVRTLTAQVLVTHQYSLLVFMGILVYVILNGNRSANNPKFQQGK